MIIMDGQSVSRTLNFPDTYTVMLPDTALQGKRCPMVICLHDLGQDHQQLLYAAAAAELPDCLGVALVIPNGRRSCFLNMAHGPRWLDDVSQDLPRRLQAAMPVDPDRMSVIGLGAGALAALQMARCGVPCGLIDPCTADPLAWNSSRWPRKEEWLGVFEDKAGDWQPGLWADTKGSMTGDSAAIRRTAQQLGLDHWRVIETGTALGDKLASCLACLLETA